jgi:hypothetical protein
MGYDINMVEDNFRIKKENADNVLEALKEFARESSYIKYVNKDVLLNAKTIYEAFEEIGYQLYSELDEDGNYILSHLDYESYGDEEKIFNAIAKYVEPDSFIRYQDLEGSNFKLVFDGETCKCVDLIPLDIDEFNKYKKAYNALKNAFKNGCVLADCLNIRQDELDETISNIPELIKIFESL